MIVWGGFGGAGTWFVTTGGRYDPQTNSWQHMASTDVQLPPDFEHLVWTGNAALLWRRGFYEPELWATCWISLSTMTGA